jgi:hypothetical protein
LFEILVLHLLCFRGDQTTLHEASRIFSCVLFCCSEERSRTFLEIMHPTVLNYKIRSQQITIENNFIKYSYNYTFRPYRVSIWLTFGTYKNNYSNYNMYTYFYMFWKLARCWTYRVETCSCMITYNVFDGYIFTEDIPVVFSIINKLYIILLSNKTFIMDIQLKDN